MPKLKPGDKAPDFIIKDLEGRTHRLYDYLNGQKTVLLFYRGNEENGHAEPDVFILHPDDTVAYASLQSGPLGRPSNDDLLMIAS